MPKIKNMGTGTMRFSEGLIVSGSAGVDNKAFVVTGSIAISGSESITALGVYSSIANQYVATIDNDASSAGHVLKLSTDGNGSGTRILEMEDGDGDIIFRARADGRFGFGPDGVDSMGAGTFVVGIDNSSHTADIAISKRLQHLGDADTYLDFANDKITLKAGNKAMVTLEEKGSAPHEITLNDGGNNIDFVVKGNGSNEGNPGFFFDASNNRVGINGVGSPDCELHVDGDVKVVGEDPRIKIDGDVDSHPGLELYENGTRKWIVYNDYTNDNLNFKSSSTRMSIGQDGKVGIGTTSPKSTLSVVGSIALSVLSINAANDPGSTYSIAVTDCVILINTRQTAQGGIDSAITLTLPDASDNPGMVLTIKDAAGYCDVNAITITVSSGDNIDGNPLTTSMNLPTPASWKKLISDGANSWYEIGS